MSETDHVYVRLSDLPTYGRYDPQEQVQYVDDVDNDNWTTDPERHRNHYDSEGAEYLRIEREYAESHQNFVPASDPDDVTESEE